MRSDMAEFNKLPLLDKIRRVLQSEGYQFFTEELTSTGTNMAYKQLRTGKFIYIEQVPTRRPLAGNIALRGRRKNTI